jgi:ADP-heptose:LPS heptosyltransferase
MMGSEIVPNVQKIVVLRALVLGDLIFILPALEALRNAYPQAKIVYIGRPWAVDFLHDRLPWVDEVIGIRPAPTAHEDFGFLIHPDDSAALFPRLQAEQFDLAFQMQGGGKSSNPLLQQFGARLNIGSREVGAIALDRWLPHDYYQHDVIRNLELAALVGAAAPRWSPFLPVLDSDRQAAEPFLANIRKPYVVIHSGARDIRRCWPAEKFAEVGDWVKRELGLEVVLTGSSVDGETVDQVARNMHEPPVNLSQQLELPALLGILSNSSMVISNDTGVLHTSLAVGASAVGLYWGEYISKSMPLSRERFLPVIAFENHCPQCGMYLDQQEIVSSDPRPCMHLSSFITRITPQQVIHTAERLLEDQQQKGAQMRESPSSALPPC